VERRVARATGLTRGAIGQIWRAERAAGPLCRGVSPIDVAGQAGYADQTHLTRSLRRFVRRTSSQIAASARGG
jgi:methylphosphotriester-DNA--protein-cysteine methyltransferase